MSGKAPPKAPCPNIGETNHFSAEIFWGEFIDRLKEIYTKEDGRILVEIQMKPTNKEEWTLVYSGYDTKVTSKNLSPESSYQFRMRFKNKHGWGGYSDPAQVTTLKQPLTGEDIHRAIRIADEIELLRVLEKGEASIEAQDKLGFTPLMAAAQKGHAHLVKVLVEWHADLESKNDSGKTALMLASFKGMNECVEALLDCGAKLVSHDRGGMTALHHAVDGENPSTIKLLVTRGMPVNVADTEMGWTPLIRCAGLKNNGNTKVVRELIRCDADVNIADKTGQTALHTAIINGHSAMIEILLHEGADLMAVSKQGYNCLDLAESMDNRNVKSVITEYMQKKGMKVIPGTLKLQT